MRISKQKHSRGNFTLVEMITVFVVIVILLAVGLPAFNNIARGSGPEAGARNLAAKLKAVRSHAVTNLPDRSHRVALIIPAPGTSAPADARRVEFNNYRYNSFRAAVVNESHEFLYWVDGENWNSLPSGTVILGVTFLENPTSWGDPLTTPFKPLFGPPDLPDPPDVPDTNITAINCVDIGIGTAASPILQNLRGIVFKSNGQPDLSSGGGLFIHVGSGMPIGGDDKVNLNNRQRASVITMRVCRFTGRVSFP